MGVRGILGCQMKSSLLAVKVGRAVGEGLFLAFERTRATWKVGGWEVTFDVLTASCLTSTFLYGEQSKL